MKAQQWIGPLLAVVLMAAPAVKAADTPGFLLLAPDRGFLGNEEVREVFTAWRQAVPHASLAFATAARTAETLHRALARLADSTSVVVLPLFLSVHHALYQKARRVLDSFGHPALYFAQPFGASYLAEEVLFDRVEALSANPDHERLILVTAGADSETAEAGLREDLQPLLTRAVRKYRLGRGGEMVTLYDWSAPARIREAALDRAVERIKDAAARTERVLVVPFNLGRRLTTMMSDWHQIRKKIDGLRGVIFDGKGVLPHPNVRYWLQQASTCSLPLTRRDIGVVLVPHGADYNWNEAMRQGIAPLRDAYIIEEAFSMVDPVIIARAVRRLERRGVRAAVLVRIFSLASSFKEKAEYVLGLRREYQGFPPRVRSGLLFHTLGGVETSPHLARALIDRIREISRHPEQETVILLAHGTDDESRNAHWMRNLKTLADYIRQHSGMRFRAVRYYTWREDWPEKRKKAVAVIRSMVEEASRDGGIALIVPERMAGRGPGPELLQGLNYRYATGFAPHPEFTKWLRATIERGIAHLTGSRALARVTGPCTSTFTTHTAKAAAAAGSSGERPVSPLPHEVRRP